MYDIVIIGSGPAGLTAGIYALRAGKKVMILDKGNFGGQMTYSPKIDNYPGYTAISGNELAEKMVTQAMELGAEFDFGQVTELVNFGKIKYVRTNSATYEAGAVIIASGAAHRKLGLEREDEFTGKGVSYCAVCDGAFYKGMDVAVVGGGNSALQEAVMLSEICKSVTVIQNLDFLSGEAMLAEELDRRENVRFIFGSTVKQLIGKDSLQSLAVLDSKTGNEKFVYVDAVFVAIGLKPENDVFADTVKLDEAGYIITDESMATGSDGIFAAGDCTEKKIRQIATAVSDGAVAAVSACRYLDSH